MVRICQLRGHAAGTSVKWRIRIADLSFNAKDLGFVQTRDQELPIALFKSIKLRLPKKLELVYIF